MYHSSDGVEKDEVTAFTSFLQGQWSPSSTDSSTYVSGSGQRLNLDVGLTGKRSFRARSELETGVDPNRPGNLKEVGNLT